MKSLSKKTILRRRFAATISTLSVIIMLGILGNLVISTDSSENILNKVLQQTAKQQQDSSELTELVEEHTQINELRFEPVSIPQEETDNAIPVVSPGEIVIFSNEVPTTPTENQLENEMPDIAEQPQQTIGSDPLTEEQLPIPEPTATTPTPTQQDSSSQAQHSIQGKQQHSQQETITTTSTPLSIPPVGNAIKTQRSRTIKIMGEEIPYQYSRYTATSAPESGCAIWKGMELTDDNKYCYFVGHNPGPFHNVMRLQVGDKVTVCDLNKKIRSYTVRYAFIVPQKSTYRDIADRVEGHGESVILQTCCGDNVNVRIVVAW